MPYTIEKIIEVCERYSGMDVYFGAIKSNDGYYAIAEGYSVGDLGSWRGSYNLPAIEPCVEIRKAGDVAKDLIRDLGYTHEGYKGGEYFYVKNDIPWVSFYGQCAQFQVCGHFITDNEEGGVLVFELHEVEY